MCFLTLYSPQVLQPALALHSTSGGQAARPPSRLVVDINLRLELMSVVSPETSRFGGEGGKTPACTARRTLPCGGGVGAAPMILRSWWTAASAKWNTMGRDTALMELHLAAHSDSEQKLIMLSLRYSVMYMDGSWRQWGCVYIHMRAVDHVLWMQNRAVHSACILWIVVSAPHMRDFDVHNGKQYQRTASSTPDKCMCVRGQSGSP